MAVCEVCGNDYYMSFDVIAAGVKHTFDSFECAIHRMAPTCEHCRCRIVGHGVESDGKFFCCAHCATADGHKGLADHVDKVAHPGHQDNLAMMAGGGGS